MEASVTDGIGMSLHRFPVPGGWLYKYDEWNYAGQPLNTIAITFVPKPRRKSKSSKRLKS